MKLEDVVVEVRDVDLIRQCAIPNDDLNLTFKDVPLGVGEWKLALPQEHNAVQYLEQPGSGLIVTHIPTGKVLISGPTDQDSFEASPEDPNGTLTCNGLSDSTMLWEKLCYPDPTRMSDAQQTAYDVQQGYANVLMRYFVTHNLGSGSLAARNGGLDLYVDGQVTGTEPNYGSANTKASVRFDVLGDVLVSLANTAGLNFRLVQAEFVNDYGTTVPYIALEIWPRRDLTATVRLDVLNGTLDTQQVQRQGPSISRVVVAGQGEGEDRTLIDVTTPEVLAASDKYGRRIERFLDQRNTNDVDELTQSGMELIDAGGLPTTAVKVVPSNDQSMQYGQWLAGDTVTVVVAGQEATAAVTEAAFILDDTGFTVGAAVGDVSRFSADGALQQQANETAGRVSQVERTTSAITQPPAGSVMRWAGTDLPSGWTGCDGQSLGRDSRASLFAAIGTKYGAVDDTHFNAPTIPVDSYGMRAIIKIN